MDGSVNVKRASRLWNLTGRIWRGNGHELRGIVVKATGDEGRERENSAPGSVSEADRVRSNVTRKASQDKIPELKFQNHKYI